MLKRWSNVTALLVSLRYVDECRDQHQRNYDDHPILKRDAKKRYLSCQPAVHELMLGAAADTDLTGGRLAG